MMREPTHVAGCLPGSVAVPFDSRSADLLGATIHYQIAGSGPTVVLVHAGIADSRMWEPQWAPLTADHRVLRHDLRGFGRSSLPPPPFAHHDDLAALLATLGIARCVLVGASYGGDVATAFALDHPDVVEGLVLANSLVGMTQPSDTLRAGWRDVGALVDAGEIEAAVELELRMWVDGPHRRPDEVHHTVRDLVREMNGALFRRLDEQEAADEREPDPPVADRLTDLTMPVLVVTGELDLPDALASAEAIMRAARNGRRVSTPDAAHLPSLERPDWFHGELRKFMAAIGPAEGR